MSDMHDCSICGCACYCHGDIDDCQVEPLEYSHEHCDGCGCSEDPDAFFDDYELTDAQVQGADSTIGVLP